ncbi:single-stranded DNA-binding protein [Sporichthya brevicatena]|uniref:Single-stranded DNA-binding protein n=1 Tax=Sporichthya brevicatena TaxID=171442 RepID=A0ABP3RWM0_9ACTN
MSSQTWVTVCGVVAADDPSQRSDTAPVKFRLASTSSWKGDDGIWRDGVTNYFDVVCWDKLGRHVLECVRRGDPVIVQGKLEIRDWETDRARGRTVQINAQHVGFDLKIRKAYLQQPPVRPAWAEEREETPVTALEGAQTQSEPAA